MAHATVPRVLVSATGSGVGKTTIACALMWALGERGLRLQACKCGPDYLDPMFHERVLGTPSRNLDLFLGSAALVRELLAEGGRTSDLTLIEGAMGYYDGIAQGTDASAYALADATDTPVVLVVDARGKALSVAAEVMGFERLRTPSHIAGVILNRATPGYYPSLKAMVESETGAPVLGYVPRLDEAALAHRHLGLVAAEEVSDLRERIATVGRALERTVDLDALVEVARSAPEIAYEPVDLPEPRLERPVVAVARDRAFSFAYPDTIDLLDRLGARVAYFSPLADDSLPAGTCGLYLCGGYPELHAAELSANKRLMRSLRAAIEAGMPTIAECGGFMYLQEELEDADGRLWPMVGALAGRATRYDRLVRFGYATITARRDTLLAAAGESLCAHEFHYWDSTDNGDSFHARKPQSERSWDCVVATDALHAGFPHLYLRGNPAAAKRFVDACVAYGARTGVPAS